MSNEIVPQQSIQELVEGWFKAEREGNQFPVPFDMAWPMAGYSRKSTAKKWGLKGLVQGEHFCTKRCNKRSSNASGVSAVELIELSMAGFEHLCLMADTPEGKAVRDLYRQAKAKWDLLQQVNPQVAQEVEILHLKIELAKQEAIAKQAEQKTVELRHYVVTALPKPVADRVLGVTEVATVEYRDRIIHNDDITNDGSTILKGDLCHRYGLLTKAGKPDYKRLNEILEELPSGAFQLTARIQDNRELLRAYLPTLDQLVRNSGRQRWIGE